MSILNIKLSSIYHDWSERQQFWKMSGMDRRITTRLHADRIELVGWDRRLTSGGWSGTLSRKRCLTLKMIRNLDRELRIPDVKIVGDVWRMLEMMQRIAPFIVDRAYFSRLVLAQHWRMSQSPQMRQTIYLGRDRRLRHRRGWLWQFERTQFYRLARSTSSFRL